MLAASNLNLGSLSRADLEAVVKELSFSPQQGMFYRAVLEKGLVDLAFSFAIVMDGDDIHNLNHQYGMAEVDRRVRQAIMDCTRDTDLPLKWGGDEWVLLLSSCKKAEDAQAITARVVAAFNRDGVKVTAVVQPISGTGTQADAVRAILDGLDEIAELKTRRDRRFTCRIRRAVFAFFPEFGMR
jgi:GGDEF domain-containing protein